MLVKIHDTVILLEGVKSVSAVLEMNSVGTES